jgi:Arc/MetJ-type ribon-helix-helix transcriptional regulator
MVLTELEKITINMGPVDLGQIDLLVREGFYQNRTDFIRTAIRNQLNTYAEAVKQTVVRKEMVARAAALHPERSGGGAGC